MYIKIMWTHAWTHANDVTDDVWTISSLYNAFLNVSLEFVAKPLGLHEFDNRKPSLRK